MRVMLGLVIIINLAQITLTQDTIVLNPVNTAYSSNCKLIQDEQGNEICSFDIVAFIMQRENSVTQIAFDFRHIEKTTFEDDLTYNDQFKVAFLE